MISRRRFLSTSLGGLAFVPLATAAQVVNVQAPPYGAKGDGATDDSSAFNQALTALPSTGGILWVPPSANEYIIHAGAIEPGAKAVIIVGGGWSTLVGAPFGDAQWVVPGAVRGTVLKIVGAADGIALDNATYRKLVVRDLAILGPGSGSSVGLNAGKGAQNNELQCLNVLIANFSTGLRLNDALDGAWYSLTVRGCMTGIRFTGEITDHRFFDLNVQTCRTGWLASAGALVKVFGGLIQSNTTGLKLAPDGAGGMAGWHFDGVWSEGNTTGIVLDSTSGPISNVSFARCRESSPYTLDPTIGSAIARLSVEDCLWGAVTLKLKAGMSDLVLKNSAIGTLDLSGRPSRLTRIAVNGINSFADVGNVLTSETPLTPDYTNGEVFQVRVTADTRINAPSNAPVNAKVTFIIQQDRVGGHAITWGAGYHVSWSDRDNTRDKYSTISFYQMSSGQWVQLGPQSPYFS